MPSNWRELPGNNTVTFAPEGGYGDYQGQSVFTHGVQIGMEAQRARDLRTATDELIRGSPEQSAASPERRLQQRQLRRTPRSGDGADAMCPMSRANRNGSRSTRRS